MRARRRGSVRAPAHELRIGARGRSPWRSARPTRWRSIVCTSRCSKSQRGSKPTGAMAAPCPPRFDSMSSRPALRPSPSKGSRAVPWFTPGACRSSWMTRATGALRPISAQPARVRLQPALTCAASNARALACFLWDLRLQTRCRAPFPPTCPMAAPTPAVRRPAPSRSRPTSSTTRAPCSRIARFVVGVRMATTPWAKDRHPTRSSGQPRRSTLTGVRLHVSHFTSRRAARYSTRGAFVVGEKNQQHQASPVAASPLVHAGAFPADRAASRRTRRRRRGRQRKCVRAARDRQGLVLGRSERSELGHRRCLGRPSRRRPSRGPALRASWRMGRLPRASAPRRQVPSRAGVPMPWAETGSMLARERLQNPLL